MLKTPKTWSCARVFFDRVVGFYVDIGACDPVEDSVTKHFYDQGWHGVNVEPDPRLHAALATDRPRDVNLCAAIGRGTTLVTFYPTGTRGHGTLDATRAVHLSAAEPEMVPQITLAQVFAEHTPADGIDFLKVDVEGWEAEVLASADWSNVRPRVVVVEAVDLDGRHSHEQWEGILLAARYRFGLFDGLNRFYCREEDAETLLPRLAAPGNVLDNWRFARELRAQADAVAGRQAELERLSGALVEQNTTLIAQHTALIAEHTAHVASRDLLAVEQAGHAETKGTLAAEQAGHAETRGTLAAEQAGHAETRGTLAAEQAGHAETRGTLAAEQAGHAETRGTLAAEQAGHAETRGTLAAEQAGHAETRGTLAAEQAGHAETRGTLAAEQAGHTETRGTLAAEQAGHTETRNMLAAERALHAVTRDALGAEQLALAEQQRLLAAVHASTSWRITIPLRNLMRLVRLVRPGG